MTRATGQSLKVATRISWRRGAPALLTPGNPGASKYTFTCHWHSRFCSLEVVASVQVNGHMNPVCHNGCVDFKHCPRHQPTLSWSVVTSVHSAGIICYINPLYHGQVFTSTHCTMINCYINSLYHGQLLQVPILSLSIVTSAHYILISCYISPLYSDELLTSTWFVLIYCYS